tara:strand:+ start:11259 stop:11642 length:384 start_codon:yes stop_codon:yes gene_type:complete
MAEINLTFIYDGECPFCNHFAELLELKSKIKNISTIDGRKNPILIKELLQKGYDLDNGAILYKGGKIYHGSDAINEICNEINDPSGNLIRLLSLIFKSQKRTKLIFPFLLRARRLSLFAKGVSTSLT